MNTPHPSCPLLLAADQAEAVRRASLHFRSLSLTPRQRCDLELLLTGAYAPLTGFLGQPDFESVLAAMRLTDGTPWPLPVSLDVPDELADLQPGERLALRDGEGFMLAVLAVESVFAADPEQTARKIFGLDDLRSHPGAVAYLRETKRHRVSGPVHGLSLPIHCDYTALRRTPADVRADMAQRGWRTVLGCQAEPFPGRRDRAEILDAAMAIGASVLYLHPVGDAMAPGATHFAAVRCAAHFAATFSPNLLFPAVLPYQPLQAGPRQALLEALIHKNYGCTHFLVSPHHGDPLTCSSAAPCYATGAAQRLVASLADETGIAMVPRPSMVHVAQRAQYVERAAVHPDETVEELSPSEMRRRLEGDLPLPEWFTFPEIENELRRAIPPRSRQGFTLLMTGLSGAGKSTLAKLLYVKFMELRTRPVTLLDGDIVRRHLSSELTFSKAHRDLNIERIGFVASEITKNGGIALCAPIAPYADARARAREMVGRYGGFVEIYLATPLDVCEQRDRKGLYAKARAGRIKGVTGIDDPYEPPADAEIVLDTTHLSPSQAVQDVLRYLERQGYLA